MTAVLIWAATPAQAQTMRSVPAGGDLQAVLNAAQPGDTIQLAPGATYVGNFILPAKSGAAYITIRSEAPDATLPAEGQRIDPRYSPLLAKLRSPNTAPALSTAPGAHHYRLIFLEFMAGTNDAGDLIRLGDGSSRQNSLGSVPYEIVVDRVYIHGEPGAGQKRGIALNSASTRIVNSYISDIKGAGYDSQAICGWNGPGPYLIANNYLEAAGENIMFGGADPAIPNLVPSDVTIVGNHLAKPWSWRGSKWTVKNLFELKSARRVKVDRNLFENNWLHAQTGYAILLKSVNQDGGAPWSVVEHVEFTNNIVRHVASAINILGRDTRYPAQELNNVTFRNNLFVDVSTRYGGAGRFALVQGGSQITFDHNTALNDGITTLFGEGESSSGFVFTNNVIVDNAYGIKGSGTATGTATLTHYFPGYHFVGNIVGGADARIYPSANHYPKISDIGFMDAARGNYRLAPDSPFRGSSTDGTDPGCNFESLLGVPASPTGNGVPGVPTALSATVSGSTVTLQWNAPSSGTATSYVLEAGSVAGASNAARADTGNSATTLVVPNVPAGVYYVRVRAANAAGLGGTSNEIVVVVGGSNACEGAPQRPAALAISVERLNASLTWAAPSSGCAPTHYVLLAGSAPGLSNLAQAAVAGHALSASAPPGTYYVRVVAVNGFGASTPSNEVVVTLTP